LNTRVELIEERSRNSIPRLLSCLTAAILCAAPLVLLQAANAQNMNSLPAAWAHWRYFRSIKLQDSATAQLVSVGVPQEVYGRSANHLADLRVIDDLGTQVPYVLVVPGGTQNTTEHACRILESSFVPGKYTQFICDVGENAGFHNAISISTPNRSFMAWTEVDVSDDARLWRIVNEHSPIYEFAARNLNGLEALPYGDTNARYVRLRIFLGDTKFVVTSMTVLRQVTAPKESIPVAATLSPESLPVAGQTIWSADFGASSLPVDEIRVETAQPDFSRRIYAQASSDGENWYTCGGGDIYRFQEAGTQKESLSVQLYEQWTSYLRIHIVNGNDPPLKDLRVALFMTPRNIVFRQEPARRYSLLYGQSEAKAPQYDISQTVNEEQMRAAQAAEGIGAEEMNTAWTDPRPWTEQHQAVLWIAAIFTAILLAFTALRSLRTGGAPPSQ
jgi:hypothetical protein